MKPIWIVEDHEMDDVPLRLSKEITLQGYECILIKDKMFISENKRLQQLKENDCVVVQSTLNLAKDLLKTESFIPNAWLNLPEYKCSYYYTYLGKYLFNNDYTILPRTEVLRKINDLNKMFGKNNSIFIRPDSGFKSFTAKVFTSKMFQVDWEWVECFTKPDDLLVVSSPKIIKAEWRFIVSNRKIITGSLYKLNDQSVCKCEWPEEVYNLVQEIANVGYNPDPVYSIDICQDDNDKYWLLEVGSFSCCGLYACDLKSIVSEVSNVAVKEWNDYFIGGLNG